MSDLGSSDIKPVNAIDIFVFSNGEQNAPPRKYHLELKEINMWKGTLRNLGNSHYGIQFYKPKPIYKFYRTVCQISDAQESKTFKQVRMDNANDLQTSYDFSNANIDIYTTDGRKVEGPSELNHLKAYVAVIPPCAFIQAGYDNYLIKASRSWEKRLLKITNSMESSTKDQKRRVSPKSEINIKIIENEAETENKIEVDMKAKTGNKANDTTSTDPTKKIQVCNKVAKCPIGNKQIRKPSFANETTTLKTQIFTPFKISSARRSVMKAKETLQTKPIVPRKGYPLNVKRNTSRSPCASSDCNKLAGKNIKHSIITSLNVVAKKSENKFQSPIPPPKLTQDNETKSSISNEETNIYKNKEAEFTSVSELKREEILNERKNTMENEVSISDKSGRNSSSVRVRKTSSRMSLINNENKKHIHCIETYPMVKPDGVREPSIHTCHNCIPRQGLVDNFVAIVNNEKVFKLQLNLEIDNGAVSLKNDNVAKETHSIKSILKEEKEIQVNMYEESNVVRERILTQFPNSDFIKDVSEEGKIIIIHCACFNDIDLNYLLQSHISHNQMCQYEFTPELNPGAEDIEEMRCTKQPLAVDAEENLAVSKFVDGHTVTMLSEQRDVTAEMEFIQCTCTADDEMMRPRAISTSPNPEDNKLDMFISRSTQTNWCSIILQAVRHEDGRYSLHLPPLLTVKNMADCCE